MVALERELPPVVAPPSADAIPLRLRRSGGTSRQVFALALIGTFVLPLFASRDLSSWLNRMGDGPLLTPLQHAAMQWDGAMHRLGLTRPPAILRQTLQHLLDWQWPGDG